MMKKIIALFCITSVILGASGCGKKEEPKQEDNTALQNEQQTDTELEAIEDGGEIDEEGNVIVSSSEMQVPVIVDGENPQTDIEAEDGGEVDGGMVYTNIYEEISKIVPEYDTNGNITKNTAVSILSVYPAEFLGLDGEIQYQMLFAPDTENIDGKECYSIAAKNPEGDTKAVLLVALDGSAAYKYDLENYKYIKIL